MIVRSNCGFGVFARAASITAAAVAVAFGLPGTSAHAAATGSYTASCKNIVDDGTTVRADCKKKNGSWVAASLAYKICQGGISNNNGSLQCTPQGSFKNSCNSVAWNESFLMANCRKKNKSYIWNSGFNYNECLNNSQDIANCDGSLKCGGC